MFPFLNFLYVFYEIFMKNRSIFFFFFLFSITNKKKNYDDPRNEMFL